MILGRPRDSRLPEESFDRLRTYEADKIKDSTSEKFII